MDFQNIKIEVKLPIALLTINRPSKLNALNKQTIAELHEGFKQLDNNSNVKVIIVTGSGEKAFVAGADIAEFSNFNVEEGMTLAKEGQEKLFTFVENLSTPVIAAVN
ncbi:MAG TPA: enoyl-CoA hydratase-related protein, partial [Flavobacteriaceae bacterium]|nr:enoyl-CoA hydratase-related protein [Flavobacteriaceae bacterium]